MVIYLHFVNKTFIYINVYFVGVMSCVRLNSDTGGFTP